MEAVFYVTKAHNSNSEAGKREKEKSGCILLYFLHEPGVVRNGSDSCIGREETK